MAARDSGVNVRLDLMTNDAPECLHGPALLFEKCCQGEVRLFYACSACRDKKDCSFFQWADEKVSKNKKKQRKEINLQYQARNSQKKCWERNIAFRSLKLHERNYCSTCDILLLSADGHDGHTIIKSITDQQLKFPSRILTPLSNNKKNAQYLFSEKTADFMMNAIRELDYDNVILIGTPRIHEKMLQQMDDTKEKLGQCKSILLDIDHRYSQFFSPNNYLRYNMFNHHFFDGMDGYNTFSAFLSNVKPGKFVLVIDPPFGGRLDILANTYHKICKHYHKLHTGTTINVPFFLIFPYFMEPRVLECFQGSYMLDYKVDYDNHVTYQSGRTGRKYGSPARIFTNITTQKVALPEDEGYRLCKPCDRYVARENVHCEKCAICPSKDGSTYKHCDVCSRCVKPSRQHCNVCNMCLPPDHSCGEQVKISGCYLCGDMNHKQRECSRRKEISGKKRKENMRSMKMHKKIKLK